MSVRCFLVCSCFLISLSNGAELLGVSHVGVTTDSLELSTKWYTEVLGGHLVPDLSVRGLFGDRHYYGFFQKEINEAAEKGQEPSSLGVPDIRDNGAYQVDWNFVLFEVGMVQLIQFSHRETGAVFPARESRTSPSFIKNAHIGLWVKKDVDWNQFVDGIKRKSEGYSKVYISENENADNESDTKNTPTYGTCIHDGDHDGWCFMYFKGPSGEQLEFLQWTDKALTAYGREYCRARIISPAFLSGPSSEDSLVYSGIYGIAHLGTTTRDRHLAASFYTEVLGGQKMDKPWDFEKSSELLNKALFGKELADAQTTDPHDIGIPDLGSGKGAVKMVLFVNGVMEPLQFIDESLATPNEYNWSSPAYVNSMQGIFMVSDDVDMDNFVRRVQKKSTDEGYADIKANSQTENESELYSYGFTEGPLDGFSYAYMKGPFGQQVGFSQFSRKAQDALHQALLKHKALNGAFDDTNPYTWSAFDAYCTKFHADIWHASDEL